MSGREPVRAAGAVLWRPAPAGTLVALVHRPRYGDWSLPKGKLDAGEHPLEAAVREVREESGFEGTVGRRLPSTAYRGPTGPKVVDYWAMQAGNGQFTAGREVDDLAWLPTDEALQRLTYPHDWDVVEDFRRLTTDTVVLLVRHAEAGERADWPQADELRPLTPAGVRQALRLAEMLALFGPHRVLCADRLRCTQTVEPLAHRLGIQVETEPGLSEEGYAKDPEGGIRRIRDLAGAGQASVVCSQRGTIPGTVATLASADGLALPHVQSRKGSVWALSFRDSKLAAADYYPDFEVAGP